MKNDILLKLKPIQKFIAGVGQDVKKYLGKDKACIIGIEDDGVFYAQGLFQWLKADNGKITFTTMNDNGKGLEKEKVRGRKALLIDNDIVTGKAYRRARDFMVSIKNELDIKDFKFAVLCDRVKVADFSVEDYPMPSSWDLKNLDSVDLEIIKSLSQNGRKTLVEIAAEIGLTPVGIKKRVERLLERDIIEIRAALATDKFYSSSAIVGIEADPLTIKYLVSKLENCPLVYNLVRVSGHHNLVISFIAPSANRINDLIEKQIRSDPKVRYLEVDLGQLPIVPKTHVLPSFVDKTKNCPCEKKCNECEYFL